MYMKDFIVLSITTDIREKAVTITMSSDINDSTVSEQTLCIYDKQNPNEMLQFENCVVKNNVITIYLKEWPVANFKYYIKLTDIENAVDNSSKIDYGQTIVFKSNIVSKVIFKNPILNSIVKDKLLLEVEELSVETAIDSFYLELAADPYYHKIIYKANFSGTEHLIAVNYTGQVYARCRVQKLSDGQYSNWEKTSFVLESVEEADLNDNDDAIYTPEYEDELTIEYSPENGVTPAYFMFAFNDTIINPEDVEITIVRRDY